MNLSSDFASNMYLFFHSYLNLSIFSLSRIHSIRISEFLVQWVMECLIQIQSTISTLQYHFSYITEIVIISFEWSERRKISSINQYQSYSSLSIHSFLQKVNNQPKPTFQEWLIEVESNLIHQSVNHSYYQILSYDTNRMHIDLNEWIWEKEDSSIQMIHN